MKTTQHFLSNRFFWIIFACFSVFYIRGLFSVIYGTDATIYASLSAEMMETKSWLQIFHKGNDYLDKPPLHFWLSAGSFSLFGINSFAYKLPSFLFTLLGTYSTFKLGKLLYNSQIGKIASLLFYTSFAVILINQDVRTDTILVGIVVFSLWQLITYVQTANWLNLILGFVGIGFAMLAKGPIGLMVPVLSLGIHFLVKKEWNHILKWQWLVGIVISLIVISPMLWGLYTQFDLQPNKEFNLASGMEGKGTSGIKFYFWDQSFGRITGSNKEWKNDSSIFFFVHTFLWSFLPWSFVGILGLFEKIKESVLHRAKHEFFTLGAIVIPYLALSKSQFQLPHYIYVFFPMWFILAGWYVYKLKETSVWYQLLRWIQVVLNLGFVVISLVVVTLFFPTKSLFLWLPILIGLAGMVYLYKNQKGKMQLTTTTFLGFGMVMFIFSFHFLPQVLSFDGPYQAAVKSKELEANQIFSNNVQSLSFDIYGNVKVTYRDVFQLQEYTNKGNYIFVNENQVKDVLNTYDEKSVYEFNHHAATNLKLSFLLESTREKTFEKFYLIEI